MGRGVGRCYGDLFLDSMESLRSCMKYDTEPSVQGKEQEIIYSLALSHHGPKFVPTYHNSPVLHQSCVDEYQVCSWGTWLCLSREAWDGKKQALR